MQRIKQELENLALAYLDPIGYQEISNYIEEKYGTTTKMAGKPWFLKLPSW
jgi:(p)ppGpp synthase/HD superfamily hydrolase